MVKARGENHCEGEMIQTDHKMNNTSIDQELTRLFPDPRIYDGRNIIEADETIVIPGGERGGWFRFDEDSGNEIVYILFSPEPVEVFEKFVADSIGTGEFEDALKEIDKRQEGLELRQSEQDYHVKLELDSSKGKDILVGKITFVHRP